MVEKKTVLAFDVETVRLATDVGCEYAEELAGASPWARPDLFGYGVGCIIDVKSGVVVRLPPGEKAAEFMVRLLERADVTVSYNGEDFDLGVLSAYRSVEGIRERHVDINALVMKALDELPVERSEVGDGRIRQGGLGGLAKANGLAGKTGEAAAVPAMLREGKADEVLSYCEQDVRLVAELYRIARETGRLAVDAYVKKDGERVGLGRLEVAIESQRR